MKFSIHIFHIWKNITYEFEFHILNFQFIYSIFTDGKISYMKC